MVVCVGSWWGLGNWCKWINGIVNEVKVYEITCQCGGRHLFGKAVIVTSELQSYGKRIISFIFVKKKPMQA